MNIATGSLEMNNSSYKGHGAIRKNIVPFNIFIKNLNHEVNTERQKNITSKNKKKKKKKLVCVQTPMHFN